MSLRRFYRRITEYGVTQNVFFLLDTCPTSEEECLICFEKIQQTENVVCKKCNKPLHITCIEKWFDTNNKRTCPHCRTNWKFEIELQFVSCVYLDEYTIMPRKTNRFIINGSINGQIPHLHNQFSH